MGGPTMGNLACAKSHLLEEEHIDNTDSVQPMFDESRGGAAPVDKQAFIDRARREISSAVSLAHMCDDFSKRTRLSKLWVQWRAIASPFGDDVVSVIVQEFRDAVAEHKRRELKEKEMR